MHFIKCFLFLILPILSFGQELFFDDFEGSLSKWEVNSKSDVVLINSGDSSHNKILELRANGNVLSLIKGSDNWKKYKIEGEFYFPENIHNYLGFIYNFNDKKVRSDFGVLYLKGNGSYIRANPFRDGNVSRLLYEEYKTNLIGEDQIEIGKWYKFKMEVIKNVCHLYINDFKTPKITFSLFEFYNGKVGFQPRVSGGSVWIDNIKATRINSFNYSGEQIPNIQYKPNELINEWEFVGPFKKPNQQVEKYGSKIKWKPFNVDKRGAVITGRITQYDGKKTVAYFRTIINSKESKTSTLHFTTIDELSIFVNGNFKGRVYRDGYISDKNDWNAWYDFWKNAKHSGRKFKVNLTKGTNEIIIRVRNGQFASGGFFAYLEK